MMDDHTPTGNLDDFRWFDLDLVLERTGPFVHPAFEPSLENRDFLRNGCKILVIGAGGLGCELLKDLALSGFQSIDVIDLDVIDVSNLNRQFLFREADVGKPKARVAAEFICARIPGVTVNWHHANIMDFDENFYRKFNLIVAGLDSIDARRWLNAFIISLVEVDEDGNIIPETVIPIIDGGTEGFLGQARVSIPKITACFECTIDLFPPQQNFPLCTIANTPRLPEHCIEYVHIVEWPKKNPFGEGTTLDTDNPDHIKWVYDQSKARGAQFGIQGVTYRLTQGVIKNIIPAVAATNAIVAAACANEALKLITYIANSLNNYMMYNGTSGIYTYTYENEKKSDCPVCGVPESKTFKIKTDTTLEDFIELLAQDSEIRVKKPSIRTSTGKTLYFATPPTLELQTRANLAKTLMDLIGNDGVEMIIADLYLPFTRTVKLEYED